MINCHCARCLGNNCLVSFLISTNTLGMAFVVMPTLCLWVYCDSHVCMLREKNNPKKSNSLFLWIVLWRRRKCRLNSVWKTRRRKHFQLLSARIRFSCCHVNHHVHKRKSEHHLTKVSEVSFAISLWLNQSTVVYFYTSICLIANNMQNVTWAFRFIIDRTTRLVPWRISKLHLLMKVTAHTKLLDLITLSKHRMGKTSELAYSTFLEMRCTCNDFKQRGWDVQSPSAIWFHQAENCLFGFVYSGSSQVTSLFLGGWGGNTTAAKSGFICMLQSHNSRSHDA